jgi:hypothetical protein
VSRRRAWCPGHRHWRRAARALGHRPARQSRRSGGRADP